MELRAPVEQGASCEERQWAARVARGVIQFARCWMLFVVERCDRGRGLRPRSVIQRVYRKDLSSPEKRGCTCII